MAAETLSPTDYYDQFDGGGSSIELMGTVLAKMELPDDISESLQNVPEATLLVLGSATYKNIDNMAGIDRRLRPSQGSKDTVIMVDYNGYPMQKHQQEWNWLKNSVRGEGCTYEDLRYPDFLFAQADMRQLPIAEESIDVVVSDYTLNFLGSYGDVQQTFTEVNRVLKLGGIMLFAVAGHQNIDPNIPVEDLDLHIPQQKERMGGLVTQQFPLQAYTEAAAQNGLEIRASNVCGTDFLCAVLQKTAD